MNTKTVHGHFGPKQITRDDFIKQWKDHFGQCYNLCEQTGDFKEIDAMKERIAEMAGRNWDNLKG